jgi:mannose-1-phosphate guanylyltransferase / mannose-6-phosphate isomerase
MHIIPTILCGGAGSRLWPVSRALHPKPFIRLHDGQSLLQKAFLRASELPGVSEVLTVTNAELYFKIHDEYQEVNTNHVGTPYILEPFGRNTAGAIAIAAQYVAANYGEEAIMLVLPADHLIQLQDAFADAVERAVALAQKKCLVTFGIQPERPETGYGYIEVNSVEPLLPGEAGPAGFQIQRFIEKPDLAHAIAYIESGRYLWNAGLFCFSAGDALKEMKATCPEVLSSARACFEASMEFSRDRTRLSLDPLLFSHVPDVSFDYAVMEPLSLVQEHEGEARLAVVPCSIGWTDIGSWSALGDLMTPDEQGNRVSGDVVLKDTYHCTIQSQNRLVGAVGLENLIIIDTPDALLVANRHQVQDVKYLYEQLKAQGHEVYKLHRTVHRPWGTYTILEEGERFKIKRIEVKPGASLSLQMHHHRSEHWIIVQGTAKVVNGEQSFLVRTNESTYIPAGHQHRLENPGLLPLVMIEVQSGEYLGEDDIVRFEDNYGRVEV